MISKDFNQLRLEADKLDKKTVIVFLSILILQTISWYFTSVRFFRTSLLPGVSGSYYAKLYQYLYWFGGDFLVFFIVPLLIILFMFREKPLEFGLRWGDHKKGLQYTFIAAFIMIPALWFVSAQPDFVKTYPQLKMARTDYSILLIYEFGMMLYMFAWEFVWRGYTLFGLKPRFGVYAIFIQLIPFVILHNGKPALETFSSIAGGLALGILAYRTRSFLYGFIIHFIIMFFIDLFSMLRYRSEEYGTGFNAILNLFN